MGVKAHALKEARRCRTIMGIRRLGGDGTPGGHRGQFVQPRGISVDAAGNVYVAESGASRIQRFSPGYLDAL